MNPAPSSSRPALCPPSGWPQCCGRGKAGQPPCPPLPFLPPASAVDAWGGQVLSRDLLSRSGPFALLGVGNWGWSSALLASGLWRGLKGFLSQGRKEKEQLLHFWLKQELSFFFLKAALPWGTKFRVQVGVGVTGDGTLAVSARLPSRSGELRSLRALDIWKGGKRFDYVFVSSWSPWGSDERFREALSWFTVGSRLLSGPPGCLQPASSGFQECGWTSAFSLSAVSFSSPPGLKSPLLFFAGGSSGCRGSFGFIVRPVFLQASSEKRIFRKAGPEVSSNNNQMVFLTLPPMSPRLSSSCSTFMTTRATKWKKAFLPGTV